MSEDWYYANKTAEIAQSSAKLIQNVDAIFISNDNTALSALQSIIMNANRVKIPVYVSDTDAVVLGALASLGPNQYQIGLQTGNMVARILNGEKVSSIPVEFPHETNLYLNIDVATHLDIKFPDDVIAQATKIISKD